MCVRRGISDTIGEVCMVFWSAGGMTIEVVGIKSEPNNPTFVCALSSGTDQHGLTIRIKSSADDIKSTS